MGEKKKPTTRERIQAKIRGNSSMAARLQQSADRQTDPERQEGKQRVANLFQRKADRAREELDGLDGQEQER